MDYWQFRRHWVFLTLFRYSSPSLDRKNLESLLSQLQQFDPPGIGARNLQESLLLQLKAHGKEKQKEEEKTLPALEEQEDLRLLSVDTQQSFTRPPPRFTEASLVKELEKVGIGRPSTYVAIMNKIQSRDYTVKEKGTLKPTELGIVIAQMLENSFKMIMDISFTATMEDKLESVAEDGKNWKDLLKEFLGSLLSFGRDR